MHTIVFISKSCSIASNGHGFVNGDIVKANLASAEEWTVLLESAQYVVTNATAIRFNLLLMMQMEQH